MTLVNDEIGENPNNRGYGDTFLDATPKAKPTKEYLIS